MFNDKNFFSLFFPLCIWKMLIYAFECEWTHQFNIGLQIYHWCPIVHHSMKNFFSIKLQKLINFIVLRYSDWHAAKMSVHHRGQSEPQHPPRVAAHHLLITSSPQIGGSLTFPIRWLQDHWLYSMLTSQLNTSNWLLSIWRTGN